MSVGRIVRGLAVALLMAVAFSAGVIAGRRAPVAPTLPMSCPEFDLRFAATYTLTDLEIAQPGAA